LPSLKRRCKSRNPKFCNVAGLDKYCRTATEQEIIASVKKHQTVTKAAEVLGYSGERYLYAVVSRVRKRAEVGDFDHEGIVIPDGHEISGVSSLVRQPTDDGQVVLQWVKTKADAKLAERLLDEARAAMVEGLGREKAVKPPKAQPDDLLNLYILTDYHLGMYAWDQETGGESWSTEKAEEVLMRWLGYAIKTAPAARTAVLGQLGDFLHWDGDISGPVTPRNKHVLDADTRFAKVVRVAIRVTRKIIQALLKKHESVHIIMAEGNHDPAASVWLREMFYAWYADEPRVTVDRSPAPYYAYEHGDTSLFFHHGHKRRPSQLDDVFVGRFREMFGRTKFSYGHAGHMHHDLVKEGNLMRVEQHRTLAASDSYSSGLGFTSGRSAPVITYSKKYGEVGRLQVTPEMLA